MQWKNWNQIAIKLVQSVSYLRMRVIYCIVSLNDQLCEKSGKFLKNSGCGHALQRIGDDTKWSDEQITLVGYTDGMYVIEKYHFWTITNKS